MAEAASTYEKPAIVNMDLDPGPDKPMQMIAPALVIAVAAGTWIVVGVEIVTYSRRSKATLSGRSEGPRLVTLSPPPACTPTDRASS